jgi:hypothetical protein
MPKLKIGKTYYVLHNTTYQPDKSLSLGRIFTSPLHLENPLNKGKIPAFDKELNLYESMVKSNEAVHLLKSRSGKFSIFAKFLSIAKISADADYETSGGAEYFVKTLKTEHINPGEGFVQKCFDMKGVKSYLASNLDGKPFKKPIFMITGVKTAHGAKFKGLAKRNKIGGMGGSGDVSGQGTGPEIGTEASIARKNEITDEWEDSEDFVFAVRLHEVFYEAEAVLRTQLKGGGQLMGADTYDDIALVEDNQPQIAVAGNVSKKDADPKRFGLEVEIGQEDSDSDDHCTFTVV